MTRNISSFLLFACASLFIPLTFTGCGSGDNPQVEMDANLDTAAIEAAEAKVVAEESAPSGNAP